MARKKGKKSDVAVVEPTVNVAVTDEQEIIEVSQTEVKKALKALTTDGDNSDIAQKLKLYYEKHEEFNHKFFGGLLSHPLITIDKMNNKTLGAYYKDRDEMNIKNHITLNINLVILNEDERVLETLVHEMIHQWQDEFLYAPEGEKPSGDVRVPITIIENEEKPDDITFTGEWKSVPQKKRPKEWHNREFKDYASVVGIPAKGPHCTGNPAKMPPPKSYNRKFGCKCIASNGYPITVWSTREIHATCNICKSPLKELKKAGSTIEVKQSHIELPGQDAVQIEKLKNFEHFMKFKTRGDKDVFLDDLQHRNAPNLIVEQGIYQKKHNAYKEGFRYWVAFKGIEFVIESEEEPVTQPKRRGRKPKAQPVTDVSNTAISKSDVLRDYNSPEDLIALYNELGSLKLVAKYFEVSPASITYQAKKLKINFKEGTYEHEKNGEGVN